ncbi:MAG: hypothetical protein ACI8X5_002730 [Planctomycetota bacterium]|jgi:hypothetical protein
MFKSLVAILLILAFYCGSAQAMQVDDGIPDGWMIIEEDILVPETYYLDPAAFATSFWAGGIVPYFFHSSVTGNQQLKAIAAMDEWEAHANVQFVPLTNQTHYILIRSSSQNSSNVGQTGGQQTINIASWNVHYTIMHEFAHALGYWHEHAREDRNTFIEINYANVCQTCCSGSCNFNFNLQFGSGRYGPYNFDSFMHYGQFQATGNGLPTITVLPPYGVEWQDQIGQRDHMSTWDSRVMSFLYAEPDWTFVDWTDSGSTESGSFFEPIRDFWQATVAVPAGGQVIVLEPDTAISAGVINSPMTLRAPVGGVVIH